MKTMIVGIAILAALLIACAPAAGSPRTPTPTAAATTPPKTTITIDGRQIPYSGSIGGLGTSQSVSGVTPHEWTFTGTGPVSAVFQKQEAGSEPFTVTLRCASGVTRRATTTSSYGVVTAAC